jgi:hypothetical protein
MRINQDAVIHVGIPPIKGGKPPLDYHQGWVKRQVHFHGFVSLPHKSISPKFVCLDHQWQLILCPGGHSGWNETDASIYLQHLSNDAIEIDYGFGINDDDGKQMFHTRTAGSFMFMPSGGNPWGCTNFASRSKLTSYLVEGTLLVEVYMKLAQPVTPLPFIPDNPSACKVIQDLFMNDEYSDIAFEVTGADDSSVTTFKAHRCIVGKCSSILAEHCGLGGARIAQINDVTPDIFRLFLFHIYGGKVADDSMKSQTKEIIDAADRYGVDNVLDHLFYADSKNCALLKEAAMDFIAKNKVEVIDKICFDDMVPGTFIRDVLVATARGEHYQHGDDQFDQFTTMRVTELRQKAHEKGLNVDGSREMLIAALKSVVKMESEVVSEDF